MLSSREKPRSLHEHHRINISTSPQRTHIGGLDGLRALAALAVLLYHTAPTLMPGGFLGVDVFFVLSGFLISSLLLGDCSRHGKVRLGRFWLRRWRRLFPAVALVAAVTIPIAALISSDLIARLPSQLFGTLTFSYNWVSIAAGHSYFDRMSPKLLTNMWTLSVEQQFYLIWPIIIALLWLIPRLLRPWIVALLAAGSATLMAIYASGGDHLSRAYMGTDSHAFGLMIGAALALAYADPLSSSQRAYRGYARNYAGLAGIAGFIGLIALFFYVPDSAPGVYPWITVLATICAAVIVFSMTIPVQGKESLATVLRALLDIPVLRWIGERSYGIYLWHWPLLVIWRYLFPHSSVVLTSIMIVSISIAAAALSYRYVENPMRHHGIVATLQAWLHHRKITTSVLCVLALIGLIIPAIIAPKYSSIEQTLGLGASTSAPSSSSATSSLDSKNDTSDTDHNKTGSPTDTQAHPQPQPKPQHKPEAEVTGENITILGDSVMLAIAQKAQEQWAGVITDGEVSRSYYAITPLIQHYDAQGSLRHFVVIGAANNGPLPLEYIEEWLGLIGPDRALILVTGHGNAYTSWIAESNNAIYEAQKAHPEQVIVADWFSLAEQNPQWLYEDLTHPNNEGIPNFVTMLQEALDQASTLPNAYTLPPVDTADSAANHSGVNDSAADPAQSEIH